MGDEVRLGEDRYPGRLRELSSPPNPVFLDGRWDHKGPIVAIVGTRKASDDGWGWTANWLGMLLMALGLVSVLSSSRVLRGGVLLRS